MSAHPTRRLFLLVRDFAALSAGELFGKLAGLLAFAYLARVLGPEAYGGVEVAVALVMVFTLVVDFGLGSIGAREVTRDPSRARALAAQIPAGRLLLSGAAFAGLLACVAALDQPPEAKRVALLFGVGLFAAPLTMSWLLQGLDRMPLVPPGQALRMATFVVGVLALVRGPDDLWRVGAVEIAAAAVMAAYFAGVSRWRAVAPGLRFDLGAIGRLLRESAPVGAAQLLWAANQYLPIFLIARLIGGSEIAFYGGAHRIVMSLGAFVWLYFFNLYPSFVRSTHGSDGSFAALAGHSFRAVSWLGVWLALALTVLSGPIARLAYGDAFGASALPLAVLAWVLPASLLSGHARFGLIGAGHQRRELLAELGGTATTVVLALSLVPALGAVGGAIALLGSAVAVWIGAHHAAKGVLGPLPFAGPLLRPAAAAAAAAGVFAFAPIEPEVWRGAAALAAYAVAGAALEPRLVGDVRGLVRSLLASGPGGAAEQAPR